MSEAEFSVQLKYSIFIDNGILSENMYAWLPRVVCGVRIQYNRSKRL